MSMRLVSCFVDKLIYMLNRPTDALKNNGKGKVSTTTVFTFENHISFMCYKPGHLSECLLVLLAKVD